MAIYTKREELKEKNKPAQNITAEKRRIPTGAFDNLISDAIYFRIKCCARVHPHGYYKFNNQCLNWQICEKKNKSQNKG